MHYIITGGAGFIGSYLTEELLRRGQEVTVIDDFSSGATKIPGAGYHEEDICKLSADAPATRSIQNSDFIFHLAALVGVKRCFENPARLYEVNVEGAHRVLSLACRFGKPLLYASTSSVYGKSSDVAREDGDVLYGDPGNPSWFYSLHKAVGEGMARANGHTAARLFNTIGPRQRADLGFVVPKFIRLILAGEPLSIYGDGEQTRSFCDVRDTVAGLMLISEKGEKGEVYNLGSPQEFSVIQLAEKIYEALDIPLQKRILRRLGRDEAIGRGYEECARRAVDISKAGALGFKPRYTIEESIRWIAAEDYGWKPNR